MESMNPKKSMPLRDLDLMTAYLRDETSESRVQEIEAEMDKDPLYQLAMEALSQSLIEDPGGTASRMKQTEEAFPELLLNAKNSFIEYLEKGHAQTDETVPPTGSWWTKIPAWQKWIGGLGGLLLVASLAMLPSLLERSAYHADPASHLILDGDVQMIDQYAANCDGLGMGRRKEVTIRSTLVEKYIPGNYVETIRQLREIERRPGMSSDCMTYTRFYLAKSFMMEGNMIQATASFNQVLEQSTELPAIAHAAHWYLGNIALVDGAEATAAYHFETIAASDVSDRAQHLDALMEKNYIQEAKHYLTEINN